MSCQPWPSHEGFRRATASGIPVRELDTWRTIAGMSLQGRTLEIRGNVECSEDVLIEGRVHGHIWNEHHMVTVGADAEVTGDIVARAITVRGSLSGTLLATERVAILDEAHVTGRVVAERFMLAEGGVFSGKVEPQQLNAALTVARHRRDEGKGPTVGTPAAEPNPDR
jgi:cytoskeletal protein CcmA (bactofilin family)